MSFLQSYMEFREADVETWMKALNIEFYWENFKRGGRTSGTALASITMETLVVCVPHCILSH